MWQKIGFFEVPQGKFKWMCSHAQLPTPLVLSENEVRVFFASRNDKQRSHIAFVDLHFSRDGLDFEVTDLSLKPVLKPGPVGHFDEHGVFPSCVIEDAGKYYMYYIGWNQGVEAPLFYASIGLAVSGDGLSFIPVSNAPMLARSDFDPCLVTSPHVYREGKLWRMSYVSGVGWSRNETGYLQSNYHIKLAEGTSPTEWKREGKVAIDFKEGETNIARPSVIGNIQSGYRMWYSYVLSSVGKYRIGYAESKDGDNWCRKDELAGIGLDEQQCQEMICYPATFYLCGRLYMLFNGDGFGKRGFGVAVLS